MDNELFDILDNNGQPTGRVCTRQYAHENGIFHRTAHIWLIADGKNVLLQKRSSQKDCFPDCYDISSAGHLTAGTDYIEGAVRELSEELGINASPSQLRLIGFIEKEVDTSFNGKPFHDREKAAVFVYTGIWQLSELTLQQSEVDGVILMDIDDVMSSLYDPSFKNCLDPRELDMLKKYLAAENNH